jgi:DNA-binding MarR family transcriptional regulator
MCSGWAIAVRSLIVAVIQIIGLMRIHGEVAYSVKVDVKRFGASAEVQLVGPFMDYLARRLRSESDAALLSYHVRPRHVVVMTLLRDFGPRSQSDLAQVLGIDPTNLVPLLNDLEAGHLIDRRRSVEDRRRHTVSLTPAGVQKLEDTTQVLAATEKRLLAALTADEQTALYLLLRRVFAGTAGGLAADPQRDCSRDAWTLLDLRNQPDDAEPSQFASADPQSTSGKHV